MNRPASLVEVAELADSARAFAYALSEFLDQFRLEKRATMLADEPMRLAARYAAGDVADAYLAAVAVSLAREIWCTAAGPGLAGEPQASSSLVRASGCGIARDADFREPRAVSRAEPVRQRECPFPGLTTGRRVAGATVFDQRAAD